MSDIKVLGICGSLRKGSFNRMALRVAQEMAPAGMKIDIADISAFSLYNEDLPAGSYGIMCSFGAGYSLGSLMLQRR